MSGMKEIDAVVSRSSRRSESTRGCEDIGSEM